ncbi:MAG: hypothetical protein U9N55_07805 [candidate division Zixibacteria bacterium]|nr:hypothetical protein [candidate division Zixibacteria bacterium]
MKFFSSFTLGLFVWLLLCSSILGRAEFDSDFSKDQRGSFSAVLYQECNAAHRVGNIVLAVQNNGTFGTGFSAAGGGDYFTGGRVPSCEYPKGSSINHLFAGAFWVGAVVGRDTLVSLGADGWSFIKEFNPDVAPFGAMIYRSTIDPNSPRYEGAISEEDYISVYTDTFTEGIEPDVFGQKHKPLYIEITEASYAWSYSYAEDFVLFDYRIKNIGVNRLKNVYMGFYVDADVGYDDGSGHNDDIAGFIQTFPHKFHDCEFIDTINAAWTTDADGDLNGLHPSPDLTAMRIVRTPAEDLDVSFNWWISNGNPSLDFGPREQEGKGRWEEDYRDFGTGALGTPEGDRNKYYIMRNQEFDYDQAKVAAIQETDPLWMLPPQDKVDEWADGLDTRYLLSFGPFNIDPGQSLPLSFAYLGGEGLHTYPANVKINLPDHPNRYYDSLHFEDLALNSSWAEKIYDNPGVDTDGDGYFGEFRLCYNDTIISSIDTISFEPLELDTLWEYTSCDTDWYKGDGVPDFCGAAPPPAPTLWLSPGQGKLRIRFNGTRSETTRDIFTREMDFEGYRVYIGRDERKASFSVVSSWDREDYKIYQYENGDWVLMGLPLELKDLQAYFQDPELDPTLYTRATPYQTTDTDVQSYYFKPQDYNISELGTADGIHKVYPDQPRPSELNPELAQPEELTENGYLKYYEYEFVIEDLLPTVQYFINVTAFDYGSPKDDLGALESSVTVGFKSAYPRPSSELSGNDNLDVIVYPNPYRIDASYRDMGLEGRDKSYRPDDRVRAIHFENIPAKCTISIFSLDGDLVKEINHDLSPSDPKASHEIWDLITRNSQLVSSGLYYYTVESESGETFIGKLAIIM